MKRRKVLLAVCPGEATQVREALGRAGEVVAVYTLKDAEKKLAESRFTVLLGTLQFDDSRLFDLLSVAKRIQTPVVALNVSKSVLPDEAVGSCLRFAEEAGFAAAVDLQELMKTMEAGRAFRVLRDAVSRFDLANLGEEKSNE